MGHTQQPLKVGLNLQKVGEQSYFPFEYGDYYDKEKFDLFPLKNNSRALRGGLAGAMSSGPPGAIWPFSA